MQCGPLLLGIVAQVATNTAEVALQAHEALKLEYWGTTTDSDFSNCEGDDALPDVSAVEISLLQRSLRLSREPVATTSDLRMGHVHTDPQAPARSAYGSPAPTMKRFEGSGSVPPTPAVALSSLAARALVLAMDQSHGTGEAVPLLLIYMLIFMIGLVFAIQVVGWCMEARHAHEHVRGSLAQRLGPQGDGGLQQNKLPGHLVESGTTGKSLLTPMMSDISPLERGSFAQPMTASGFPEADTPSTLCPALLIPHGEAQFVVLAESLRSLVMGRSAIEVLGASGRPLLYARLAQPGGASSMLGSGHWLELATTPTSRYPHASLGPLMPGAPKQSLELRSLEVHGPQGNVYGSLESRDGAWCVQHAGRLALQIMAVPGSGLQASTADHVVVATGGRSGDHALLVQVNMGADALLSLLCILAVVLMSPDLAGFKE